MDWSLRAKMAALLVLASVLPLAIATSVNIQKATGRINRNTADVLAARAEHLTDQLDVFNRGYQRSVDNVAHLPLILEYCQAGPERSGQLRETVQTILRVWPNGNSSIRGLALIDLSGKVMLATEDPLSGMDLSYHSHIREALNGAPVISNVYIAEPQVGNVPTIAYLAPVFLPNQKLVGVAAFWVKASALWDIMKKSNELAGPGSFAVLFDHLGIRIGHTYSDEIVFHPGGVIDLTTAEGLVTERRFGGNTRQVLDDVRPFPEQFERSLAESPDLEIFHGFAPGNQTWNYGVARRFKTVPWTVFYMVPDQTANAKVTAMWQENAMFAAAIMLLALVAGLLFAAVILRPIRLLSRAAKAIARGDLSARVPSGRKDELGRLGTAFNFMAAQIETQATALQKGQDDLEDRVRTRTAELVHTNEVLSDEIAERRRTEVALRESKERVRAVVDTALDGIITMDHEGRIVDFNPSAEQIFNYRSSEVVGEHLADKIIPRALREGHRRGLEHFLATGEGPVLGMRIELTAMRSDGSEFPVELSITRVGETDPPLFTSFIRDITERKKAEDEIRANERRFRGLVENSSDAIALFGPEGSILYASPSTPQVLGYSSDEMTKFNAFELIHPDDHALVGGQLEQCISHPKMRISVRARVLHKDGEWRLLEGVFTNLLDEPNINGIVNNYRDVTERERAEERFRQVIESSPNGIVMVDKRGSINLVNEQIEKTFGYSREELLGKSIEILVPKRFQTDHPKHRDSFFADPSSRPMGAGRDLFGLRKDGSEFPVEIGLNPMQTDRGIMVLGTIVDITERKSAEEAIRRSQEQVAAELEQRVADRTAQLQAANKELEAFSYSVSHDLRAPLRHINGFSQALLEDYADKLDDTGRNYLNEVCGASNEMAQLIDDVLELARVTRSDMRRDVVNLSEVAATVTDELKKMGRDRDVTTEIEKGLVVNGDKRLLQIVLSNLIGNAWKFTSHQPQPKIVFGSESIGGETVYFVRDNGAGFDMTYADKLFGTFQRLHSESEFDGTGIGLATVRRIVDRHGGRVWGEGRVNEGATFYFTIPDRIPKST